MSLLFLKVLGFFYLRLPNEYNIPFLSNIMLYSYQWSVAIRVNEVDLIHEDTKKIKNERRFTGQTFILEKLCPFGSGGGC